MKNVTREKALQSLTLMCKRCCNRMMCKGNCSDFKALADYLDCSVTQEELENVFNKYEPSKYTGLKADVLLDQLRKELL